MDGRKGAFLQLALTLLVLGLLLAFAREIDWMIGKLIIVVTSIIVLWKLYKSPKGEASDSNPVPTWISALPKKWQKWVLGE
jgi:hypothetical protein